MLGNTQMDKRMVGLTSDHMRLLGLTLCHYKCIIQITNSIFRCTATGQIQATANFDNCVSGNTVTAFGIGYDYKSVMHYGLKR